MDPFCYLCFVFCFVLLSFLFLAALSPGHLLGKGWPLGSLVCNVFFVLLVTQLLIHLYLTYGVHIWHNDCLWCVDDNKNSHH